MFACPPEYKPRARTIFYPIALGYSIDITFAALHLPNSHSRFDLLGFTHRSISIDQFDYAVESYDPSWHAWVIGGD